MKLQKWNYEKQQYEDFEVPSDWRCRAYVPDILEPISCPHCGKILPFYETYTSLEVHTPMGFGYGVCGECYEKEWERRRRFKGE